MTARPAHCTASNERPQGSAYFPGYAAGRSNLGILGASVMGTSVKYWPVARGKPAKGMGKILNIAKRIVDAHAQTAGRKLGTLNRAHAVAIAVRNAISNV
jgi:hypothetical protein